MRPVERVLQIVLHITPRYTRCGRGYTVKRNLLGYVLHVNPFYKPCRACWVAKRIANALGFILPKELPNQWTRRFGDSGSLAKRYEFVDELQCLMESGNFVLAAESVAFFHPAHEGPFGEWVYLETLHGGISGTFGGIV